VLLVVSIDTGKQEREIRECGEEDLPTNTHLLLEKNVTTHGLYPSVCRVFFFSKCALNDGYDLSKYQILG
jgi:hypothetical protein